MRRIEKNMDGDKTIQNDLEKIVSLIDSKSIETALEKSKSFNAFYNELKIT